MTDPVTQAAERIERTLNGHMGRGATGAAQVAHLLALLTERVALLEEQRINLRDRVIALEELTDNHTGQLFNHEVRITDLETP